MDMGAKSQEENWPNTLQILVVEPAEGPGRANVELEGKRGSRREV